MTACGGGDAGENQGLDVSDVPDCADVWVSGETLPDPYDGCMDGPDALSAGVSYDCEDGSRLVVGEGFYTVAGVVVAAEGEMAADKGYGKAFAVCTG